MKGKMIIAVRVLSMTALICLLSLSTAYAAPAAAQKSTQQAKPAAGGSAAALKYNPNAPPQGTITITNPQSGKTWYTGTYQLVEWTCNGTRSNSANVTLWRNNQQFAVIWTGSATGRAPYIVPWEAPSGSYELRVTSDTDTRIEARSQVTIVPTSVTIVTPETLYPGSRYTITWSYTGTIQGINLAIVDSSGKVVQSIPNISAGANGNGVWPWTVPAPALPAGKSSAQYRFQISGKFRTSVTGNATVDKVLGTSNLFTIKLYEITVSAPKAGEVLYLGDKYTVTWTYKGNPPPLNFSLCGQKMTTTWGGVPVSGEDCGLLGTSQFSSMTTGAGKGSFVWTLPTQPPNGKVFPFHLKSNLPEVVGGIPGQSLIYAAVRSPEFFFDCKQPYTKCTHVQFVGLGHTASNVYCSDLSNDAKNCGKCENKCGPNMICAQGKCK